MEAIKCPNCGSEKVKELTKEKYLCQACDNMFLVHNLSKEFQKTDSHISEMHEDLRNAIDNIVIQTSGLAAETAAEFENAFHLIKIKKYDVALEKFEKLCLEQSSKYQSWWGKFLVKTYNMEIFDESVLCSDELIECIENMRICGDYPEEVEDILCKYLEQGFQEGRNGIEEKLAVIENKVEKTNQKMDDLNLKKQKFDEKRESHFQLGKQLDRMSVTEKLFALLGTAIAEVNIVGRLFGWLGESIDVINAPLEEVGLGSAFLNLLAIPVKFVIGIVIVIAAAIIVFVLIQRIYAAITGKSKIEGKIADVNTEEENLLKQEEILNSDMQNYNRDIHKLKKHIELYEKLNFADLETLRIYRKFVKNYTI